MPAKPSNTNEYLSNGCGRCKLGGTPQCKVQSWVKELKQLRSILRASGLTEEIKWSAPCYTADGKNVLMLSALKESVVVSFFRGAQMSDPENMLEKPGKNSRFARYLRFASLAEINFRKEIVLSYVREAIEIERSGEKTVRDDSALPPFPDELTDAFASDPAFKKAFEALTPGRQRGYLIHFSSAKQSETRASRIKKSMPKIQDGKGWNER